VSILNILSTNYTHLLSILYWQG